MEKANFTIEKPKQKSERAEVINELFSIYANQTQKNLRKRKNWGRYVLWLKSNKTPNTRDSQRRFTRSKLYIKEMKINSFCFLISHIPTKDLYFLSSVGRDMNNREQSFGAYLISSVKK